MKRILSLIVILFIFSLAKNHISANEPNSAYLFAYTTKDNNKTGLLLAWSIDQKNWYSIGNEFSFFKSDFSSWGDGKRMYDPILIQSPDGYWHILWSVTYDDPTFTYSKSKDLISWSPQSYPILDHGDNCKALELRYDANTKQFLISWIGDKTGKQMLYSTGTKDFSTYAPIEKKADISRLNQRSTATILGKEQTGTIHKVSWGLIDKLIQKTQLTAYKNQLNSEAMKDDALRFSNLKSVDATISLKAENKAISDKLIGIFFEDINYAADGGIYAELIQNRDFEYNSTDRREWNSKTAWKLTGDNSSFEISTEAPIHKNNPHYAVLTTSQPGSILKNEGFSGIALRTNEKYDFSTFTRILDGRSGKLKIQLVDADGTVCGETTLNVSAKYWKKHTAVITSTRKTSNAHLEIIPQAVGSIALDMISLFPQKTFHNRKNGLRSDLAQALADMKPRFVRFPGGCVAHGDGIDNIYHWKNTIGALEERKPQRNLWGYHQSFGLGYFEYFQFCEDIRAAPLPVVAAGVPCQNSAKHNHAIGGQQGGIPMCEMDDYIQDILDLIEWANGDPKTNKWAKMRAEAGHPKPFDLKYLGIGNEDLISDVFEERFEMIFKAVKEKYPEIEVVGTTGPFSEGSDYERGWELASQLGVPIVDEHYYQPQGWFLNNQYFYDRYDRNKPKVYLGEYAAHVAGRHNNIETALVEALHLTNVERNADIVTMTSYAPLLAKEGYTQWNPDLIYFNNEELKPTVGYYVQQLFGQNSGEEYIFSTMELSNNTESVNKRIGKSVVRDTKNGNIIIKLVNLLPVEVNVKLDLSAIGVKSGVFPVTILSGTPDDKQAKPEASIFRSEEDKLQPYSFTVIRIGVNK